MQLISILLMAVSFLTLLSGVVVFGGAPKKEKGQSAWFLIATIFATIWATTIVLFLNLESSSSLALEESNEVNYLVDATFFSALFIDVALLGYLSWQRKSGRIITSIFGIIGILLAGVILASPWLLYSGINIKSGGNSIDLVFGPFLVIYGVFLGLVATATIIALIRTMKESTKSKRKGYLVLLVGFALASILMLIFNFWLTLSTWDMIWVGPLSLSLVIICFYFAVLRYRMITIKTGWLRVLSYVVMMLFAAVAYMVIFAIVFSLLFRGAQPSTKVIVLNFVMIAIVLLAFPGMSEVSALTKALISPNQIDLAYIMKRLSKVSPKDVDLEDVARFLAFHMHYKYIGFLVEGRIYESEKSDFSKEDIDWMLSLEEPENGVWQGEIGGSMTIEGVEISGIAALRGGDGKAFGQMIFGKQTGKMKMSWQDKVKIETIVNLVAVIIDSKMKARK